jgi:hypothetical protein
MGLQAFAQNPSVSITPSGPIVCAGTKLDAVPNNLNGPYTYLWSTGATTSSIFITQSNFYRVSVRGTDLNGNFVTVRSNWYPFLVIPGTNAAINPIGPISLCPGQTVELIASGGQFFSSYQWNTGATTRRIVVGQSGQFTVTVTNSFGSCTTSTSASVDVTVFDPGFVPAITALSPLTVCQPGFVDLAADSGSGFTYAWSTGATTQNVSVLMDGSQAGAVLDTQTVTLTVTLNNQCSFTNSVVTRSVRQPELLTNFCGITTTISDSVKSGLVLTYNSTPQYEFEFVETTNQNGPATYHTSNDRWCRLSDVSPALQVNKFYLVRVRAVVDSVPYCFGDPCVVGIVASPRFGDGQVANNGIVSSIFPNPSASSFNMMVAGINADQPTEVRVTDPSGRLVNNFILDTQSGMIQFGDDLSNGMYLVSIKQGDNMNVTRIVKTN